MAAALLALGKLDESLEVYRRLGAQLAVARLHILGSMALPVKERSSELKDLDKQLAQIVKDSDPFPVDVTLLRAQSLAAQDRYSEAVQLLTSARDKKPDETVYWTALAALAEQQGKLETIPTILAEAEGRVGDRVELRLARASYWAAKGGDEALRALKQLAKGADKLDSKDQLKFWRGLTSAYTQLGNTPEAVAVCGRVVELRPNSLNGWLLLFDLNLQAGDEPGMKNTLENIERIEGQDGALANYGKILYLIWQAEKGNKWSRDEARRLLVSLAARRPGWARVACAEARLEELAERPEQAITSYQRAIELGERSPAVFKRLLNLLLPRGRFIEADQAIRKLPEQAM